MSSSALFLNSLCSCNSTQAGAECVCKDRSFLWLIHDCDFHYFMKIRFLQGCRLGKLQPCQAAVLLQQFILKENYTSELLLTAVGFAPQGVCRDSPLCFARLGEALLLGSILTPLYRGPQHESGIRGLGPNPGDYIKPQVLNDCRQSSVAQ